MTIALVCLLAICVLLLAGLLVRAIVLRRRLLRSAGLFPCRVRLMRGTAPRLTRRPRGRAGRAEWKHDILLVHHGLVLTWAQPLAVRIAQDVIKPAGSTEQERLGAGAIELQLRLDDEAEIAVSAPAWARERLAGPFLAIAAHGLPPDIAEQRR